MKRSGRREDPGRAIVDVVIPFGGGLNLLSEQLTALLAQEHTVPRQVIVSLNVELERSQQDRLRRQLGGSSNSVRFVEATRLPGPAHARNVGWRSSTADYILFCDADDRVDRNWVGAMVKALDKYPLVGGRLEYELLNHQREAKWQRQSRDALPSRWAYLPFTPSCNMGASRELLSELEGFDENFRVGEDIDFCWRAQQAGHEIHFAPDAFVHYRLRKSVRDMIRQSFVYGRGDAPLIAKHRALGAQFSALPAMRDIAAIPYFAARALIVRGESWKRPVVIGANLIGRLTGKLVAEQRARSHQRTHD
ncbi:glycosyltransferase family 2 protein [Agromyces bauzanensis]